jgi:hypothetical protein
MNDVTPTPSQPFSQSRVNLALMVTICLEAVAGLLWVGAAAQRITVLEGNVSAQQPIAERMARIETSMVGVRATLDRIENHFDLERAR